jgi:hypothetical protein
MDDHAFGSDIRVSFAVPSMEIKSNRRQRSELPLAFSFSLAAGRYDQPNTLVLREANTLRDTRLRVFLLVPAQAFVVQWLQCQG